MPDDPDFSKMTVSEIEAFVRAHPAEAAAAIPKLTKSDISGAAQLSHDTKPFPKEEPVGDVGEQFDSSGAATEVNGQPTATGKADAAKDKTKKLPAPTETPQTEWEQLNDQLANTYGATIAALNPANDSVASQNAATDSTMSSDAEADLGQAGNSPMAQWLNTQNAAVASQSQATTAAEQAQVAAEDKGAGVIQNAIKGLGTAEQAQQTYAPYQQLLQSLAADVPYQLLSGNTLSAVDTNVQNALNQIGLGGKIPLTDTAPGLPSPTTSATTNSALATSLSLPTPNPAPQG